MSVGWNWLFVIVGSLLILTEVALGGFAGFDLVLIGSALVVGGGLGLLFQNAALGFLTASVLAVLYIALGRRWVRRRLRGPSVPSNVDALLGLKGVVTRRVAEHEPGMVRVRDEVWRAVPAPGDPGPFEPGTVVEVESVDGVTLRVRI
jgi:membrane protein implicated in regulation of membrane protease activity